MALTQGKLSRRTFLSAGVTAACGTGAALVVGCGGGSPSATQAPNSFGTIAASPRRGGQITIGRLRPLPVLGFDPHTDRSSDDITQLIYSRLYSWDPVNHEAIFNDLATAVEIPDPEHSQFIFSLRRGVRIHSHPDNPASGEELTSEDCKQSFIRCGTSITASDKRLTLLISGTNSPDGGALGAALQTPDPYTFSFRLSRPFAPALSQMAKPDWSILPVKVIEKFGKSFTRAGIGGLAFGSGPFMLAEFRGTERIVLTRHPEYFLSPRPWLDRIVFAVATNHDQLVSGLKSGRLDATGASIGKDNYVEMKEDSRFILSRFPTLFYPCLHVRIRPPFDDVRVREAIDLALDREKFIDALWGGEGNYNGPIPWPLEQWALPQDELRRLYPHDPSRARALLQEAGYADGFSTTMKVPSVESSAVFDIREGASRIVADLSDSGITANVEQADVSSFIAETIQPGNFEMAFFPNIPYDEPDRPLAFYTTRGITGVGNWNNYTYPELDELVEAQAQELDEQRRREIIQKAQRLMIEEHGPQITLPSGWEYHAHSSRIHYPYEIGEAPSSDAGPWGSDIWTEEV
jgi:peptide/nickel transport system substrate-binding protein